MSIRLAAVQPRLKPLDPEGNVDRCVHLAWRLRKPDLVVFPELASSGHGFRTKEELETVAEDLSSGPSSLRMQSLSRDLGCTVVAGIPERSGGGFHNAAIVAHEGRLVGTYRKRHLYGRESQIFTAGDRPPRIYGLGKFSLAMMICLDLGFVHEFPPFEGGGVNVIAHPSNLSMPRADRTTTVQPTRKVAYIVTANRIGRANVMGELQTFTGRSAILSPDLRTLKAASHDEEEAISVTLDARTPPLDIAPEA